jgi:hypothetical protein
MEVCFVSENAYPVGRGGVSELMSALSDIESYSLNWFFLKLIQR